MPGLRRYERVRPVARGPQQDERRAKDERLKGYAAASGIDELGKEGEEKKRRLGIEDVHHHCLEEDTRQRKLREGGVL